MLMALILIEMSVSSWELIEAGHELILILFLRSSGALNLS